MKINSNLKPVSRKVNYKSEPHKGVEEGKSQSTVKSRQAASAAATEILMNINVLQ